MPTMKEAATQFLGNKRIAVTGVSREPKDHGSNTVYKRLRERGYDVFPVNPNADEVEGAASFHDLKSIPGGVDAVVIATAPDKAEDTMRECAELGIKHVWMHRGPGAGSVSATATEYGRLARHHRHRWRVPTDVPTNGRLRSQGHARDLCRPCPQAGLRHSSSLHS